MNKRSVKTKSPKKKAIFTAPDISIKAEKWQGWHIVIVRGKFVVKSMALVRKVFDQIENHTIPHVAIDLSLVLQIDSSALTVLLNFQKRLQEKNGTVVIIGPNADIKDTLYLVGFNMVVPIYNTRAQFEQAISEE